MPLQRQVQPVLLKGLDQLAPRQTGIASGLDSVLNMYTQQGDTGSYEVVPRPGTTAITRPGGTGGTVGTRFATLNGQLLMLSDSLLWRRALDRWHKVTYIGNNVQVTSCSQTSAPIFSLGVAASSCDAAYVNGYKISAVVDGTVQRYDISVTDANGAILDSPNGNGGINSTQVRIAVSGTVAIVFLGSPGTTTIWAIKFDTSTTTFGSLTAVTTTATGAVDPMFDVQTIPSSGKIAVLWSDSATGNLTQTLLDPSTMTVSGTTAYAPKGTNFVTKGYLANSFSTGVLFVGYISSATGLHVDQFDSATLAAGTATVYDAAATTGASITGYRSGTSTAVVFYTVKGTLPYDDVINTSTGAAVSMVARGRAVASRCTDASGGNTALPLFWTKYRGVGQATYFLFDGKFSDIARAMPDIAGADPSNTLLGLVALPSLMVGATASTYVTAGLKSISLLSGTGGITSNTGAAATTIVLNDPNIGRPVELNGSLHFPGALPLAYDGNFIAEEGFPLAPEQSDAYVYAGGGSMTASSTYSYRYVYEWTDGNGALYQSAPNLTAQQAVLGAGQTKVTHAIPQVLVTRKPTFVSVAIYRTPANGDGSVYYRVGSVFIAQGGPSRTAFVDTTSDIALVTGVPLYTDDNTLENLAPPPCTSMAIHRGRILVGGIDGDQTAVWFSKDVVPGFGVAFNDGLVSRLNSANEPVTALGSMDAFAAAFTNSTTWTSSDDYPDDTGSQGVLKFVQASSSNGCAAPRLIARTDEGLVCWQAKTAMIGGPGPGPWRFSRGSTWEWIGKDAQLDAAAMTTPRAIIAVPGLNQVRIIGQTGTVNGNAMVFESIFGTWANWTYLVSPTGAPTIVDAIVWGGQVVYLDSDGHALLETTSLYSDTATAIAHSITMSQFNFAGVAGYQRIYVGQLTGRVLGTAGLSESLSLSIVQTIDGTAMAAKALTVTPDSDGLFGVEFDPGPNGKCSAYQVTISNAAGGANDSRCAWTLAAVTMEVGIKPNVNRLPPAKRAV